MRIVAITLVFLAVAGCYAQSGGNDNILIKKNDVPVGLPSIVNDSISFETPMGDNYGCHGYVDVSSFDSPLVAPVFEGTFHYVPAYHPSVVNPGVIYKGEGVALMGTAGATQYPGMMVKEAGVLGASFDTGRAHLYVGGIVNKYGFHGGMFRQLGVEGQFTYQISSPLSFTAFAYYYGNNTMPVMPNGGLMPPSMLGYYDVSKFGGYVNYNASEHFGIQMGGQVVERIGPRNHYEVEPIFTPYINVGSGKKKIGIGLPVGQILYGIFRR